MTEKKGKKIAKDDVVRFIIKEILRKGREVPTQDRLTMLVNQHLKEVEPNVTVSSRRIRHIALSTPGLTIKTHTRKGSSVKKCPVCSKTLKPVYTKNLKGKKILYKVSCPRCGYEGVNGRWNPKKYSFYLKE